VTWIIVLYVMSLTPTALELQLISRSVHEYISYDNCADWANTLANDLNEKVEYYDITGLRFVADCEMKFKNGGRG
jgi:hypothetical protein